MVAMIFEFWFDPEAPEIYEEYLRTSAQVRRLLEGFDGFHGVERFQSTADPHKFVALGYFTDEDAVTRWRTTPAHRRVQALGRSRLFTRYRLRMAEVTRDYDADDRAEAPSDSRGWHEG
jgi:heme-degrading monooxygenase HmoA